MVCSTCSPGYLYIRQAPKEGTKRISCSEMFGRQYPTPCTRLFLATDNHSPDRYNQPVELRKHLPAARRRPEPPCFPASPFPSAPADILRHSVNNHQTCVTTAQVFISPHMTVHNVMQPSCGEQRSEDERFACPPCTPAVWRLSG